MADNQLATDFLISLAVCCLRSHQCDSRLRPFPPMFIEDGVKNFDSLRKTLGQFESVQKMDSQDFSQNAPSKLMELFNWLNNPLVFRLTPTSPSSLSWLKSSYKPDLIFSLERRDNRLSTFDKLKEEFGSRLLFHGTPLENVYSICYNGLTNHLTKKTNLFGEGMYFSSDMRVAMQFVQSSNTWDRSCLGHRISCLLVVDVINHPSVKNRSNSRSEHPGFPETYFVVQNNDLVSVKYLLLFIDKKRNHSTNPIISFVWKYGFQLVIGLYVLILLFIGWKK